MPEVITDNIDLWTSALLTKSTAGRGSNGRLEAYGIKKLRGLILELAVRGKLVPQDPSDEPAKELLKEVSAEKARLVKAGAIRKENVFPKISDEEIPYQLPIGWEWMRLGEYVYLEMGQSPSSDYYNQQMNGLPFFQGKADFGDTYPTARYWCTQPQKYAFPGDILLSVRAPVGPVNIANIECCIGRGLAALRPLASASTRYLLTLIRAFEEALVSLATGTTFAAVSKEDVSSLVVCIPPLAEQHRIVAKVDELMALCDQLEQQQTNNIEAHQTLVETLLGTLTSVESQTEFTEAWTRIANHFDTLFTTEQSIDQLKQTILQLAVMGKLVPQDPNDEPAGVLLKKIAAEKSRLVKEGKIKKEKQDVEIGLGCEPFDIPDGWSWSNLSQLLALVTDGDHQAPPQSEEGIPFLVIGNLNTGNISFDGCKYVSVEYYEKLDWGRKPVAGDLLYTVTGSFGIRVPVVTSQQFCVQRHVAILKATDSTPVKYLSLMLGSKLAINYATQIATGIAQKTVPLTGLRRMRIPLAPEKEQHRIVAKVNELMALCDTLKARLAAAQTTQIHLADTIVEQAVA